MSLSRKRFQSIYFLFLYSSVLLLLLPLAATLDSLHVLLPCVAGLSLLFAVCSAAHVKEGLLKSRRSFSGSGEALVDFLDLWLPLWKSQQVLLFAVTVVGMVLSFGLSPSSSSSSSSSTLLSGEHRLPVHHSIEPAFPSRTPSSPLPSFRHEQEGMEGRTHAELLSSSSPERFPPASTTLPTASSSARRDLLLENLQNSPTSQKTTSRNTRMIPGNNGSAGRGSSSFSSSSSFAEEEEDFFFSSSSSLFWFLVSTEQAVVLSLVLLFSSWVLPATTPAVRKRTVVMQKGGLRLLFFGCLSVCSRRVEHTQDSLVCL